MVAPRILVVDDEPVITRSCKRILSEEGYRVETLGSGRVGLDHALREKFDVVVTDLKMPDLDGMELIRRLRTASPDTVVVVITGYGSITSAVEATKLGVREYLEKPFTPREFSEAVVRALPKERKSAKSDVQAETVHDVLRLAAMNPRFAKSLLYEGTRKLSGFRLSSEAKAAICSGDIAWIEKRCGELKPEEREWLQGRLQAETW